MDRVRRLAPGPAGAVSRVLRGAGGDERRLRMILGAALVCAAAAVYAPTLGHGFIGLDDPGYVVANPRVRAGLTPGGVVWAFTTTAQGNWHPVTWLSLMLDATIAGVDPRMFHATNVVLHLAGVLTLFLVLARVTGSTWRSAAAAGLFALHPLRVESVAWVAERKDVLSTPFLLLAIGGYARYVARPALSTYLLVAAPFAVGLMAKPMLVTLPLLLLLLDVWLLGRKPSRGLLFEKIPLFALSAASSVATLYAQERGGALRTLEHYPLDERLANAAVACATYLVKTFWPSGLAVYYPHPHGALPASAVVGSVALIAAVTAIALLWARRRPPRAVGWLWYLISLVPVLGIVQVGGQAMADRYTYVPSIGLLVAVVWSVPLLAHRRAVLALSVLSLALLGFVAHRQVRRWGDEVGLFEHAIAVTAANPMARNCLGNALFRRGDLPAAAEQYAEAIRISPRFADPHGNLCATLLNLRRPDEAEARCREALRLDPLHLRSRVNLGLLLLERGRLEEAEEELRQAVRGNPDLGEARRLLGVTLARQGRFDEAIGELEAALRIDPKDPDARRYLDFARTSVGR